MKILLVKGILLASVALFVLCFLILVLHILNLLIWRAYFLPTPHEVIRRMLELADIREGDVVFDLGCGDARILLEAWKKYRISAVGIEISPPVYALALLRRRLARADITLIRGDVMDCDLETADVVFCYLLPSVMSRLEPKLRSLPKGCRIVSHQFEIPGWTPKARVIVETESAVATVLKYEVE